MRTEREMYELIIGTAAEDERIRAAYMNGSRTNPNVQRDPFQDYDIVYVVKETESFQRDRRWIDRFGKRLYMQFPEENAEIPEGLDQFYGWLMQFADGNRLDLHVETVPHCLENIRKDKLCRILLDKDDILPELPAPTDEDYRVKQPEERQFLNACNEFWWCLNNVAKGLWREEALYVQDMVNCYVRPQLIRVLSWKAGLNTGFSVSVGKNGKYLDRFLSGGEWERLLSTYASCRPEEMWEAVLTMCGLLDETAAVVAAKLGFRYDREEAANSRAFLAHVRELSGDAEEVY